MKLRRAVGLALLVVRSFAACAAAPPPPVAAPVEDEWSHAPSPEWLVATHGASAAHSAECGASFAWLERDEACVGAAGGHPAAHRHDLGARSPPIDTPPQARGE
jgi:hypothetical protein